METMCGSGRTTQYSWSYSFMSPPGSLSDILFRGVARPAGLSGFEALNYEPSRGCVLVH